MDQCPTSLNVDIDTTSQSVIFVANSLKLVLEHILVLNDRKEYWILLFRHKFL